jgi:hypothetical protein
MPTAGDVLLDVAFRAPPTALIEHFVGTLPTER